MIDQSKMNSKILNSAVCLAVFLTMGLTIAGCGGSAREDALTSANSSNLQRLSNLYDRFLLQNKGTGPKDEAAFKDFIGKLNAETLKKMNISGSTDDLFTSDRDGAPFKVRYGVSSDMRGQAAPIIFETKGVDGTRIVGFTQMKRMDVTSDDEYNELLEGTVKGTPYNPLIQKKE